MASILFFGQARFGRAVLDGLLETGHQVTAVCVPPVLDGATRSDELHVRARELGLRVVTRRSYKDPEAVVATEPGRADLAVLAFVTQIIPVAILDGPRLGSVCFHPSMLPRYRGGSAISWQLVNGETEGGITAFRPDDGIDSGPVYLQRSIAIGPDDSAGSYYYDRVFEPGVEIMLEAVEELLAGRAKPVAQDESVASHDPLYTDAHAAIDWARPARALHDLVRGCDPTPGAHCAFEGKRLRLYGSHHVSGAGREDPGTVLSIDGGGMRMATADGILELAKLRGRGTKTAAAEFAKEFGLRPGSVLEGGR